jgi:hypothetical protein
MSNFFDISWCKEYHLYIETKRYYGLLLTRCNFCTKLLPTRRKIYIVTVPIYSDMYFCYCNESCFNLALLSCTNKHNFKITRVYYIKEVINK